LTIDGSDLLSAEDWDEPLRAQFLKAYQGEIWGEAFLLELRLHAEFALVSHVLEAMAEIERVVSAAIAKIARQIGHDPLLDASLRQAGITAARNAAKHGWTDFLEKSLEELPAVVAKYRMMSSKTPPRVKFEAELLAEHEVVLLSILMKLKYGRVAAAMEEAEKFVKQHSDLH
jgi:hypothetical protein